MFGLKKRSWIIGGVVAAALFLASLLFVVLSVPLDAITKHL